MGRLVIFFHWRQFFISSSRAGTPSMSSPAVWARPCRPPPLCLLRSFAPGFWRPSTGAWNWIRNAAPRRSKRLGRCCLGARKRKHLKAHSPLPNWRLTSRKARRSNLPLHCRRARLPRLPERFRIVRRTLRTPTPEMMRTMTSMTTRDFGGNRRGLGLGRLLVAVAVLALVIPAGLWMLEPQFQNRAGQAARAAPGKGAVSESAPVDIAALQAQPSQTGNTERFETAKPDPVAPPERTAAAQKPGAAVTEGSQPQPKQPDAAPSTPVPPAETAGEKAPSKVAIAEPVPLPLSGASVSSPVGLTFKDCSFCPSLVVVPKGEFTMGSNEHPHEKPAHKVKIPSPFAIGQYEVTIEEWDRCVDAGACRYRPEHNGSPKQPVGNLSWDDANAYVKWLSEKTGQIYRLPSEAEWEYAARAGTGKRFWWGDEAGSGKANCSDCGSGTNGRAAAGWHLQAQSLWPLRYGREHGRVGPGLLERILSRRARRRFGMGEGQLQPASLARRLFRQQVHLHPVLGALSLRQRCPLRSKRLPRPQGVALIIRLSEAGGSSREAWLDR